MNDADESTLEGTEVDPAFLPNDALRRAAESHRRLISRNEGAKDAIPGWRPFITVAERASAAENASFLYKTKYEDLDFTVAGGSLDLHRFIDLLEAAANLVDPVTCALRPPEPPAR